MYMDGESSSYWYKKLCFLFLWVDEWLSYLILVLYVFKMDGGRAAEFSAVCSFTSTRSLFSCLSSTTFPFSSAHKNNIVLLERLWGKSGNYEDADRKMSSIILPRSSSYWSYKYSCQPRDWKLVRFYCRVSASPAHFVLSAEAIHKHQL